ncbi:MAG: hypothetical protein ABSH51_22285 [Solirubrobacteraceae bacterium]
MRRSRVIGLAALGVVVFLAISALLARAFSVGGAEDAAITSLVRAEARGDAPAVVSLISGCAASRACRARAAEVSTTLKRPGAISIVQLTPSASFSLGPTLGVARVAWLAGSSLPRVQCVRVRHTGNVLQGFGVELLEVSARIGTGDDCPSRF